VRVRRTSLVRRGMYICVYEECCVFFDGVLVIEGEGGGSYDAHGDVGGVETCCFCVEGLQERIECQGGKVVGAGEGVEVGM
jgi:hypothetical protein